MVDINQWMKQYQKTIRNLFGDRVLFIGLQGSYGRNEANENSDIDVVLILDTISLDDLKQYKQALQTLPDCSRICGFVSGKEELAGWCRAELFQFYHDTIPYYGDLNSIPPLTDIDIRNAVHTSACTLYHQCIHNYLHENDMDALKALYKSAFFILQAKHYLESKTYIRSHAALKAALTGMDLKILQYAESIKVSKKSQASPEQYTELMLQWTKKLIRKYQ